MKMRAKALRPGSVACYCERWLMMDSPRHVVASAYPADWLHRTLLADSSPNRAVGRPAAAF
jgi:hypothetical protein